MTLSEFYDSTPREAIAVINASAWRADRDYRNGIRLAWQIAALQRGKQLPDLDKIMPPSYDALQAIRRGDGTVDYRGRPKPTPQQEFEMWMAIATSANAIHEARVAAGLEPGEGPAN